MTQGITGEEEGVRASARGAQRNGVESNRRNDMRPESEIRQVIADMKYTLELGGYCPGEEFMRMTLSVLEWVAGKENETSKAFDNLHTSVKNVKRAKAAKDRAN